MVCWRQRQNEAVPVGYAAASKHKKDANNNVARKESRRAKTDAVVLEPR